MIDKVIATLPAMVRRFVEAQLPDWFKPRWATKQNDAMAFGPGSEIGWFDLGLPAQMGAYRHAPVGPLSDPDVAARGGAFSAQPGTLSGRGAAELPGRSG